MTSKKWRYVLHPGWVESKDGQKEFISHRKLRRLYGLDSEQLQRTVVYGHWRWFQPQPTDMHLHPSPTGEYSLPEEDCEDL
jgi:hypothetical protein